MSAPGRALPPLDVSVRLDLGYAVNVLLLQSA
jgi:hypothetical protein